MSIYTLVIMLVSAGSAIDTSQVYVKKDQCETAARIINDASKAAHAVCIERRH